MSPAATLFALYELETVARRFGGKYAKKILVTTRPLVSGVPDPEEGDTKI